jgi:hypothetical protein
MLGQKLKAKHHVQGEDEHSLPCHPKIPLGLRIEIERESRRMAGYWHGKRIAETFLELFEGDPQHIERSVQAYLEQRDDPRLVEIMSRLVQACQTYQGET